MRGESWSVERIALLRRLWSEGATADVIGARLGGLSRSAVLGKVFRLRLRGDPATGAEKARQQTDAKSPPNETAPARRRKPQPRGQQVSATPAAVSRHRTLLELTNHTCRWPHGRPGTAKFFFCGALGADLAKGIPYCAQHMRRAYRPDAAIDKAPPMAGRALSPHAKEGV